MKKIYTLIFSLVLISNIYGLTYEGKLGFSPDFLSDNGLYFNMGLDIYGEQRTIVQPGIGIILAQFSGDTTDGNVEAGISTTFNKLPVFGIAKFNLLGIGSSVFYLKGFGGWQFINDDQIDSNGGLYYGYGLGFDFSSISIEYFLTKESYTLSNGNEHNGSFATIGIGYKY